MLVVDPTVEEGEDEEGYPSSYLHYRQSDLAFFSRNAESQQHRLTTDHSHPSSAVAYISSSSSSSSLSSSLLASERRGSELTTVSYPRVVRIRIHNGPIRPSHRRMSSGHAAAQPVTANLEEDEQDHIGVPEGEISTVGNGVTSQEEQQHPAEAGDGQEGAQESASDYLQGLMHEFQKLEGKLSFLLSENSRLNAENEDVITRTILPSLLFSPPILLNLILIGGRMNTKNAHGMMLILFLFLCQTYSSVLGLQRMITLVRSKTLKP